MAGISVWFFRLMGSDYVCILPDLYGKSVDLIDVDARLRRFSVCALVTRGEDYR